MCVCVCVCVKFDKVYTLRAPTAPQPKLIQEVRLSNRKYQPLKTIYLLVDLQRGRVQIFLEWPDVGQCLAKSSAAP